MQTASQASKSRLKSKGTKIPAHADHTSHLPRLKRIKGQVEGIERMIEGQRYCTDILTQVKAVRAALAAMESEIFKTHLRGCVKAAITAGDPFSADSKVEEIIKLVYK
jgi:DNA-binding FrmR family transcriptional regulator